jgi:hypothetical protein
MQIDILEALLVHSTRRFGLPIFPLANKRLKNNNNFH